MNLPSKISFIIGVFAFMATCSGQEPSDKKPLKHFLADIMKVDSILSSHSSVNKQRIINNPCHIVQGKTASMHFEFSRIRDDWNECAVCPLISEIIRPKNERDE